MNKKFYLGAILLGTMVLSTGALTSCIDNDEPEGITELRGAKAELLRAKAAVQLAKAETEKQTANLIAAQAAVQQAIAAQEQAKVKIVEAEAKIEEAKAALLDALTERAKAEALKALTEAEKEKELAKLEIEKAKAEAEAHITEQKRLQAISQQQLENILREIETAKAVLTGTQQAKLTALQEELTKKQKDYNDALSNLLAKQEALFNAVNGENKNIAAYEKDVEEAKANLAKVNASYESLKALAENAEITAWEKELKEIKEYAGEDPTSSIDFNGTWYQVGNGSASVEAAEIALAGEKALAGATEEKAQYEADRTAYIQAQQYYNYLADPKIWTDETKDDCFDVCGDEWVGKYGYWYGVEGDPTTHEPSQFEEVDGPKTYEIPGHKFEVENSYVAAAVGSPKEFGKWEVPYRYVKTAFAENINDDQLLKEFRTYKKSVADFKVTAEQIAEDNCKPTQKEWTVASTQEAFDKAVDLFEKMHQQYQTEEIVSLVSTAKVDAAVAAYNQAYNALNAAVEAANTTYDAQVAAVKAVLDAQTTAEYDKKIAAIKLEQQMAVAKTWLADTDNSGVVIDITSCKTLEEVENLIKANNSAIKAANDKLDAATVIANLKKDSGFVNAYEDYMNKTYPKKADRDAKEKEWKGEAETAAKATKAYTDALAAQTKANNDAAKAIDDAINKDKTGVEAKYAEFTKEFDAYVTEASKYAQKLKATANYETLRGFKNAKGEPNKYADEGDDKDKPSKDIAGYVVKAVQLDKDGKKYEYVDGHVALTVPAMNTQAVTTALTLEVDKAKVAKAWEDASNDAFGYLRHTALTEELLQESNVGLNISTPANSTVDIKDENGDNKTITGSALGNLLVAKKIVESHEELAKAGEAAAELLEEIEAYEQEIKDVIAPITAAVQKAEEDVEAAKAAHIASYNAYKSIAKEYVAKLNEIEAKVAGQTTVYKALYQIINAYYKNTEFVYINQYTGKEETIKFYNAEDLLNWVENELYWYEEEFHGYIVRAEKYLAEKEQILWEATNNDDFDAVAQAKQDVEAAQAKVDLTKSYYDYALAQLQKYLEALAQ